MDTIVEPCVMTFDEKDFIPRLSELPVGEHRETDVRSKLEIDITMDGKGRMLMKLKPEDEDTPMTDIDKLVQELEGKFKDVLAYDIHQIIKYLHSHGYLGASPEVEFERAAAKREYETISREYQLALDKYLNGE